MGWASGGLTIEDNWPRANRFSTGLDARIKQMLGSGQTRRGRRPAPGRAASIDLGLDPRHPAQIAVVSETIKYLGIHYVWAGATPRAASTARVWSSTCTPSSAFISARGHLQAHLGRRLVRPSPARRPRLLRQPRLLHHVGIYVGRGLFIHAPHTGDMVKVTQLAGRGCARFHTAGRHQPALTPAAAPARPRQHYFGPRPARRGRLSRACRGTAGSSSSPLASHMAVVRRRIGLRRAQGVAAGQARAGRVAPRHPAARRRSSPAGLTRPPAAPFSAERLSADGEQLSANLQRMASAPSRSLQVITSRPSNGAMRPLLASSPAGSPARGRWSDLRHLAGTGHRSGRLWPRLEHEDGHRDPLRQRVQGPSGGCRASSSLLRAAAAPPSHGSW